MGEGSSWEGDGGDGRLGRWAGCERDVFVAWFFQDESLWAVVGRGGEASGRLIGGVFAFLAAGGGERRAGRFLFASASRVGCFFAAPPPRPPLF